jgi:tRNA-specific 2-thiouridylase
MSGGVDSSLTAALLVESGHEVVGATLRTFCYSSGPAHPRSCCGMEGVSDARQVARRLGFPHVVVDAEEAFTRDVVEDFVREYAAGRTPNPCVRCNSFTKFRDLLDAARDLGAEAIATGHYVRMEREPDGPALLRGADRSKDQAYFLWGLPSASLPFLHFPLGTLTKAQVRAMARERGLETALKPESQEICFVPTGDYRDLLRTRLGPGHPVFQEGAFVTVDGGEVGRHGGFAGFTVGQRRGLPGGFPQAMFVVELRPATREVVLGTLDDLLARGVELADLSWLGPPPGEGEELEVQLRHRATPAPARVEAVGGRLLLRFREPQTAVTPGQSGALFRGDRLLGGGIILRALKSG